METIYEQDDASGLPRTDWVEVESGSSGGTSGKIAIIQGAAGAEDANGNPTPAVGTFPPANYPIGSLFYPTSYPATLNSGADTVESAAMVFRREGAAGSEEWAWIQGSYRASNSNGTYQRWADGAQRCRAEVVAAYSSSTTMLITWTFPAVFASTGTHVQATPGDGITGTAIPKVSYARTLPVTISSVELHVIGSSFTSGEVCNLQALAEGVWA